MEKSAGEEAKVAIKKELNDDIKEFAENAMNELLGWYGYGSRETRTCRSHSASNSSGAESPKFNEGCGWCGKPVDESTALSSSAATFCSELCFSQSRRANFKKNKTCDWCRHVRHTVSYVDSQDGSSQLQFCSDKCLNQYKMHIFWRETRAHLEIHPHLHPEDSSGTLITPDLWLNKCKSPSKSPDLETQTSPLPLITVAPPSKLISRKPKSKKKKSATVTQEMPQDLRVRHTPDEDLRRCEPVNEGLSRKLVDSLVPPPTVLVPYPIILPIPIPIPIPIPVPIPKTQKCEATQTETKLEQVRTTRKRKRFEKKFVIKNKKILTS